VAPLTTNILLRCAKCSSLLLKPQLPSAQLLTRRKAGKSFSSFMEASVNCAPSNPSAEPSRWGMCPWTPDGLGHPRADFTITQCSPEHDRSGAVPLLPIIPPTEGGGGKKQKRGSLVAHLERDVSHGGNRKALWASRRAREPTSTGRSHEREGRRGGFFTASRTKGCSKATRSISQGWLFCPN